MALARLLGRAVSVSTATLRGAASRASAAQKAAAQGGAKGGVEMSALVDVRECLDEFRQQPRAIRQVLGGQLPELTRAQQAVAQMRSELGRVRGQLAALKAHLDQGRAARARKWDNPREDFEDLVEAARAHGGKLGAAASRRLPHGQKGGL